MKTSLITASFISALALSSTANAFVITPENNSTTLANTILGSGIIISNVNYNGANGASGIFTDGNSSGISIDKGIVLSTGQATNAIGPNDNTGTGTTNGTSGYAPLTAISGFSTYDASVLKFDFEFAGGEGGDLFFNFVFGSEEYLEWVNSEYNDVFGFFVDGVNVALTPGSGDPITINTINNTQNSGLFINNESAIYNTQMDGFTKSLQISLKGLSAGLHTMEFAIADAGDSSLDSWIFIEADSFSNVPDPIGVPEPSLLTLLGLMLAALGWRSRRTAK